MTAQKKAISKIFQLMSYFFIFASGFRHKSILCCLPFFRCVLTEGVSISQSVGQNGVMQDGDASYVMYTALFFFGMVW